MTRAQQFKHDVLARDNWTCLRKDGSCDGPLDAHHVIREQVLRKLHGFSPDEREAIAFDPRIGLTLCRRHHKQIHGPYGRLHRAELPAHVFGFVGEFDLEHKLDAALGENPFAQAGT